MKVRGIIGKRIIAIRQQYVREACRPAHSAVLEIELENGWILRPTTHEMENNYATDFVVCKPHQKPRMSRG